MSQELCLIGFDLGHGKIALSRINMPGIEPEPLLVHNQKSEVTAIAEDPTRGITLFGKEAINHPNVTELQIAFKARPSYSGASKEAILKLAKAVYKHLIEGRRLEPNAQNYFFVGCPSGWDEREIKLYTQLMEKAGLPCVKVVKESRAALMHAKESKQLKEEEIAQSVLVVDLGSSTTDYTLVKGGSNEPIDFGEDLGASLIDKAILKYTLEHDEDRATFEEIFRLQPSFKFRCEFLCRKTKEEYFSYPRNYEESYTEVSVGTEKIRYQGRRMIFEPQLNGPIMRQLLEQPLANFFGRSWPEAFRYQLKEVKRKLAKERISPSAILLTGGASKMAFVPQICAEVFPNSPYKLDNEPELCIARGLARWGKLYMNTEGFLEEINQFIQEELPTLIVNETPVLIGFLAEALANGVIEEVLKPRIRAWRNSSIKTLHDLESDIKLKIESWLKSYAAEELIRKQVVRWLETIGKTVDEATEPICVRYSLPHGTFGSQAINIRADTSNFQGDITIIDPTGLANLVGYIVTIVIGVVIALVGNIIIFTGPMGWLLGIVTVTLTFSAGEEYVKSRNLYQWVRNLVSDDKIEEMGQEQKPQLSQKISEMLDQQSDLKDQIVQSVTQRVKQAMEKQVEKARKLIM